MATFKPFAAVAGFFGTLSSAVAVSAAVRNHRKPSATDLQRLGIDARQFARIRRD